MITAALILKATTPEQIFSAADAVEAEYRILAKRFHPDIKPDGSTEVFQHLNMLHAEAKLRFKNKTEVWQIPGVFAFKRENFSECHFHYVKDFEAGIAHCYIGRSNMVAYVFPKDVKDLIDNAVKTIESLTKFPDDGIKKSIQPNLPKVLHLIKTNDDRYVLILERPPGTIRLRDVFEHVKNDFDPKHMAWILSRLYNLSCYLEWVGITHHDISLDSVFINPAYHTVSVLGGWWFASSFGKRMTRMQSSRTIEYAPQDVLASKITSSSTDLELIRLLGRELMNDASGVFLSKNKNIPAPLCHWLRMTSAGKPKKDYTDWDNVIIKSFGPKKFITFNLLPEEVYKM